MEIIVTTVIQSRMISIGFLLLIPLIVSGNDGFSKLSDVENTNRLSKCSDFTGFSGGPSEIENKLAISFISPRHFVTNLDVLNNYNAMECGTHGNMVTAQLKPNNAFSAKLIGECKNEPTGAILGEIPNQKTPKEHYYCIRNEEVKLNETVIIKNRTGRVNGTVVSCNSTKNNVFCMNSTFPNAYGFVFVESDDDCYQLVGTTIGSDEDDKHIIEIFFLGSHLKDFCDTAGICDGRSNTTSAAATTTEQNTTVFTTTHSSPISVVNESTTTHPSKPSNTTVVVPPSPTVPTTQDNTTIVISPGLVTTMPSVSNTTESIQNSTTQSSSSAPSASVTATTPSQNPTTRQDSPKPQPSSNASTATTAQNVIPPHAESQSAPDMTLEIDCEEENLCFDEDIFSSSIRGSVLLISALFLVFWLQY